MKGFLKIESIWEDDSLLEIKVVASNGKFSGEAECYTNRTTIAELGNSLIDFPNSLETIVEFTTGERDDLSFFSLKFYCGDGSGHIYMKVKICHNEGYSNKKGEQFSSVFEIPVEPSQIDKFVKSLNRIAIEELGSVSAEIRASNS